MHRSRRARCGLSEESASFCTRSSTGRPVLYWRLRRREQRPDGPPGYGLPWGLCAACWRSSLIICTDPPTTSTEYSDLGSICLGLHADRHRPRHTARPIGPGPSSAPLPCPHLEQPSRLSLVMKRQDDLTVVEGRLAGFLGRRVRVDQRDDLLNPRVRVLAHHIE